MFCPGVGQCHAVQPDGFLVTFSKRLRLDAENAAAEGEKRRALIRAGVVIPAQPTAEGPGREDGWEAGFVSSHWPAGVPAYGWTSVVLMERSR